MINRSCFDIVFCISLITLIKIVHYLLNAILSILILSSDSELNIKLQTEDRDLQ